MTPPGWNRQSEALTDPVEGRSHRSYAHQYAAQRQRLLAALTAAVAERGYLATTVPDVVERAGLSRPTFYNHFADLPECFEAAHEAAWQRLFERIEAACAAEQRWPLRVRAAIAASLALFASEPAAARLLLLEPYAADPRASRRHEEALARLASLLAAGRSAEPAAAELTPLTEDALVSSLLFILAGRIQAAQADRLPAIAPDLTEFVLTPYLGVEEARHIATIE